MTVYLDHNATSPLRPEAREAMAGAFELAGANPSSVHAPGRAARAVIEDARERLSKVVNAPASHIVLTSGGAEAVNAALAGAVASGEVSRVLVSAIEHDATVAAATALLVPVEEIPVTPNGVVDLAWLEQRLSETVDEVGKTLIAVMAVNNETGVIQPVLEVSRLARNAGAVFLLDAVQALGKIPVETEGWGADFTCFSAHKVGGPAGAGALVMTPDAPYRPLVRGGGQERGRRSGTENLIGAVGFAAAAHAAVFKAAADPMEGARDRLQTALLRARPDAVVLGAGAQRVDNTLMIALPGFASETQVMALDLAGFAVSAGAACSSGKVKASHVAMAMGASAAVAECTLRISFGWTNTAEDGLRFAEAWIQAAERASPLAAA